MSFWRNFRYCLHHTSSGEVGDDKFIKIVTFLFALISLTFQHRRSVWLLWMSEPEGIDRWSNPYLHHHCLRKWFGTWQAHTFTWTNNGLFSSGPHVIDFSKIQQNINIDFHERKWNSHVYSGPSVLTYCGIVRLYGAMGLCIIIDEIFVKMTSPFHDNGLSPVRPLP